MTAAAASLAQASRGLLEDYLGHLQALGPGRSGGA